MQYCTSSDSDSDTAFVLNPVKNPPTNQLHQSKIKERSVFNPNKTGTPSQGYYGESSNAVSPVAVQSRLPATDTGKTAFGARSVFDTEHPSTKPAGFRQSLPRGPPPCFQKLPHSGSISAQPFKHHFKHPPQHSALPTCVASSTAPPEVSHCQRSNPFRPTFPHFPNSFPNTSSPGFLSSSQSQFEQITKPYVGPPPSSHPLMFVHTYDLERLATQKDTQVISNIRPLNPSLSEQFKSLRIKVFDDHVPTERSEEFYSISFEFFMRIEDLKGAALTSKVEVFLTKAFSDCADNEVEILESLNSIVHVRVTVSCVIALELLQELLENGAEAIVDSKIRAVTTFRGCFRASVLFVPSWVVEKVCGRIKNIQKNTINVHIVRHHVNNKFYNLELLFFSSKPFSPESIFKGRSTADCLYAGKIDKFQFTVIAFQHYAHHSKCLEVVYYPFEEPSDDYLAALSAANPCIRKNSYLTTDATKRHVLLWTSTNPTWPKEIVIKGHTLTKRVVKMFTPPSFSKDQYLCNLMYILRIPLIMISRRLLVTLLLSKNVIVTYFPIILQILAGH
ncbi:hypothetical protein GEMRC1_010512 [Eukaryota sp. GEM-RC1]